MDVPKVIAITGVQAAGKSTVAQMLAERLERSAHVRGDTFRRMLVSGQAPVVPGGGGQMQAELTLRYQIAAMVADRYAAAGFTAVVQDVILGSDLAEFAATVRTRPFGMVVLAPDQRSVAQREQDRRKTAYKDGWTIEGLDAVLHEDTPKLGLWLDTSSQTPSQTVDEILARLPETLVE
ncbi:AAA family ATPase [Flindersiella endophytica]